MNNSIEEIWAKINQSKNILMSLHYNPDGDSLGSCTAMKYVLEKLGKNAKIISRDFLNSTSMDLKYAKEVEFEIDIENIKQENFDLFLALDCTDKKQFGFTEKIFTINIDHHATNNYFGNMNYISKRSSACSVLLDIFRAVKFPIDSELATRILLGIYTDSGAFSHDNGESIKDASYLIDCGAEYLGIVNRIKYNVDLKMKKYYGLLYERFKVVEIKGLKIGYSYSLLEDAKKLNLNISEIRGGANDLQEIGGIDILFTLSETDEYIKGSFRSRKNIDLSLIAQKLDGGGHRAAAAFKIPKMSIQEAEKIVLETIKNSEIVRY